MAFCRLDAAAAWSVAAKTLGQLHLPHSDPLQVRFTDLHKWITQLEGFAHDPAKSNEGKLEAIQMAWYDEWKEAQE